MPINKVDIKLKQSQRLDDTDYGGGQATSIDVISGEINNLYPDISRLDRTYGRVSLRKAFLQVDTKDRSTYYGAHSAITKNATDPNVSVCFFTDNDWFSQRYAAKTRIENYLVQGPQFIAALWGNHYRGTKVIQLHTSTVIESPRNGEVLVLVSDPDTNSEKKQYVRIQKVEEETKDIASSDNHTYKKKILMLTLGTSLQYDFEGTEIFQGITGYNSRLKTCIYTTAVADASSYYGVSELIEDSKVGDTQIRIDSIYTRLLPSTQSSTAITDAGIASTISAVLDSTANDGTEHTITKDYSYRIESNGKLYIGTGVKRGSLVWKTNPTIQDDGAGNIVRSGTSIGSIDYTTGVITFISGVSTSIGTGELSYIPAVAFSQAAISGAIPIEVGNRGYVYTYMCNPIPMKGTLRVDYLAGGKWYTLKDDGRGALVGSDPAVGAGQVNLQSGSVAITLGAQPDIDSSIMLFWAQDTRAYDLSGGTYDLEFQFTARHTAIARNSVVISWNEDTQAVVDNGRTELVEAVKDSNDVWVARDDGDKVGKVAYATGDIQFKPGSHQEAPFASENFWVRYDYGEPKTATFTDPPRGPDGRLKLQVPDAPINPYTLRIEWHTDLENYGYNTSSDVEAGAYDGARRSVIIAVQNQDPTHIYYDDGEGGFQNEKTDLSLVNADDIFNLQLANPTVDSDKLDYSSVNIPTNRLSKVNYATGEIDFMPDRRASYPIARYKWRDTGQRRNETITTEVEHQNPLGGTYTTTETQNVTVAIQEYGFDGIQYRLAPCILPYGQGRTIKIEYRNTDGANSANYYIDIPNTFYIKPSSKMSLIPGSVQVRTGNGIHLVDVGTGELYYNINSSTGLGTKCGTINYDDRVITITEDLVANGVKLNTKNIRVVTATGTLGIEPVSFVVFRAPASPLVPGSLQLRATMGNGSVLTATSDTAGRITGAGVDGTIDFTTGVCHVTFGEWITDTYGALEEYERPSWYAGALKQGNKVYQPYSVKASTVVVNCTATYYLSLDSKLLGLDPVRLPIDGKVPIFRDGYIILIHSSKETMLPDVEANKEFTLGRTGLSDIAVYDAAGQYYPEITSGTYCPDPNKDNVNYTVDLANGKVKFSANPDFNNYTVAPIGSGNYTTYKAPFRAKHRVEDMCLATDVQITGHIGLNQPLTHAYKAGETQVSSVLPAGDLQSAAYNEFVQNSWDNVWSDDLRGYNPLANYNFVDFPIQVTNEGAIKERWLIRFTSSSSFDVVGENLGVLLSGLPVVPQGDTLGGNGGWVSAGGGNYTLTVKNRLTNNTYWTMDSRGFSTGWQSGNCIRFNTDGANMPYWFVRTTLQAPPQEATDDYQFLIRGDAM